MPTRTFPGFVAPSLAAMVLLIALPLLGVGWLAFHNAYLVMEVVEVETRSPPEVKVERVPRAVLDAEGRPLRVWERVGGRNFVNITDPERAWAALSAPRTGSLGERLRAVWAEPIAIDFWGALEFTPLYVLATTPAILLLGLGLALAVDRTAGLLEGPSIFLSLLPFIVTPVVGALSIKWLFLDDAVASVALEAAGLGKIYFLKNALALRLPILLYGIWHAAPFAFVVFHAGLQTLPKESIEAALVDGASWGQRLRHVVLAHLAPLVTFVTLIHVMDAYRVLEPILVFSGGHLADSLQHLTYYILNTEQNYFTASASALSTIAGVLVLLVPILVRAWRAEASR